MGRLFFLAVLWLVLSGCAVQHGRDAGGGACARAPTEAPRAAGRCTAALQGTTAGPVRRAGTRTHKVGVPAGFLAAMIALMLLLAGA